MDTTACIVGGGPAGMMLGWLLARAGIDVVVVEKHGDFLRDFRGDTIHPSTLDLLDELGALDAFLALPHSKIHHLDVRLLGEDVPGADLSRLPTHHKYVAMMPQWTFLDFVRTQASAYPGFHLDMEAEVSDLLRDGARVTGVKLSDGREVHARLVVGCDGRHSTVRALARLPITDLGAPIDVLWFRIPHQAVANPVFAHITASAFLVTFDRGDYWQCAFLIPKGGFPALQAAGLDAFRATLRELAPVLAVDAIRDWSDIKLLSVVVDRLKEWAQPGLLCIGDAAHAMSPVGGVGINLAIQDAVATANLLWQPLRRGTPTLAELRAVQARRERATRKTQQLQVRIHERMLAKVVARKAERSLRIARWLLRHVPAVRRYMAKAVGVGFTPEHVTSPT